MTDTERYGWPALTHAKAHHRLGPVCGAADVPSSRVTEDPHLVTCPDCEGQAEFDALPDDGALRRRAAWHGLWGWACLLLVVCLVVQAVYVYRTAIATEVPALRPVLQAACTAIGCEVGYARRIERISITGSSLQPPAAEAGAPADGRTRLLLTVTLRNRYDKPQPWPALVLELTDLSDTVVVRKIITPDIYLPPGTEGPFPAGGERTLAVPVQTTGVQVNGYQLDRFFP